MCWHFGTAGVSLRRYKTGLTVFHRSICAVTIDNFLDFTASVLWRQLRARTTLCKGLWGRWMCFRNCCIALENPPEHWSIISSTQIWWSTLRYRMNFRKTMHSGVSKLSFWRAKNQYSKLHDVKYISKHLNYESSNTGAIVQHFNSKPRQWRWFWDGFFHLRSLQAFSVRPKLILHPISFFVF
jgi:hypothetical protein